jgi:uncharacterized PurR-regulated membrane protein YhhQ (DUF165 family)
MFLNQKLKIDREIKYRREFVFLVLIGLFLGSLTMLNILGLTRFIDLSKYIGIPYNSSFRFSVAVGVLAYPITFLCTDFISEIYGRRRANQVVWVGLILNIWVLFILWIGGSLNAPENIQIDGTLAIEIQDDKVLIPNGYVFYQIRNSTFAATFASMLAYILAQFLDVRIFHYLKKLTGGKHLWLRNNASTLSSQLIDSIVVILITYYFTKSLPINQGDNVTKQLIYFILSSYFFKFFFSILDTIPFYYGVRFLRKYLKIEDEIE